MEYEKSVVGDLLLYIMDCLCHKIKKEVDLIEIFGLAEGSRSNHSRPLSCVFRVRLKKIGNFFKPFLSKKIEGRRAVVLSRGGGDYRTRGIE